MRDGEAGRTWRSSLGSRVSSAGRLANVCCGTYPGDGAGVERESAGPAERLCVGKLMVLERLKDQER